MIKLFTDTEFTGLHQHTTLISIGIRASNGATFYAESTSYDKKQVNPWLQENVIDRLFLTHHEHGTLTTETGPHTRFRGTQYNVGKMLRLWLYNFPKQSCQLWYDCGAYDHVLLQQLVASFKNGYPTLPDALHYIPMDLSTLLELAELDPDISREEFSGGIEVSDEISFWGKNAKHNALWDAFVIEKCYQKALTKLKLGTYYESHDDKGMIAVVK